MALHAVFAVHFDYDIAIHMQVLHLKLLLEHCSFDALKLSHFYSALKLILN